MEVNLLERIKGAGKASPAEIVLLVLVGAVIVGGSALVFFRKSEPEPPPIERIQAAASNEQAARHADRKATGKVVLVHVAGMVVAPGVYELPENSRIKDAIAAAGGPKDGGDIDALNLAAPLSDGQKITVGRPGEAAPVAQSSMTGVAAGGLTAGSATGAKINLNTATLAEHDTLPSIGPVLAERILAFRHEKGRFTSVSQLRDIEGIGPKKYDGLKDLVTL